MVGGAKRREHVWRADGSLFQDLRSLAGGPAKILNSELLAIRRLKDCAPGFVLVAMLRARFALRQSDRFATRGDVGAHRGPYRGVESNTFAGIVPNRRTSALIRPTRVEALRAMTAKEKSEGAGDHGKRDDQARLPKTPTRNRPLRAMSVQPIQSARPHARPNGGRNRKRCLHRGETASRRRRAGKFTYSNIFYIALTCGRVSNVEVSVRGRLVGFGP
jgi:hypothetical protein